MKKKLFALVALSLPIVLFILLEFSLRFNSLYSPYPLFISLPSNNEYLIANPDFGSQYFPDFKPSIAAIPFSKQKNDSILRVVTIGGSSAAGFPYQSYFSFSGQLSRHLMYNVPQYQSEVINLSMTAINSYQYVDMIDEIIAIQPDVVLVYGGHNEFFGAYGSASNFGFSMINHPIVKQLIIKLNRLALIQIPKKIIANSADKTKDTRTLMAKTIKEVSIPYKEPLYNSTMEQFELNMRTILSKLDKNGIPVIMSKIGSNLKDQKPLGTSSYSDSLFQLAKEIEIQTNISQADSLYMAAKEHDPLRFRAPEEINQILEKLHLEFKKSYLIDGKSTLKSISESGIEDNSVFTDHLHPNDKGHYALSVLFFESILKVLNLQQELLDETVAPYLPISSFDQTYADIQIAKLTSEFPFEKNMSVSSSNYLFNQKAKKIMSKSLPDSLSALTYLKHLLVIEQLSMATSYELKSNDTLSYVKHAWSLANWQLFNKKYFIKSLEIISKNPKVEDFALEMSLLAANYHNEAIFFELNGAFLLKQNKLKTAKYWLEKSVELNPNSTYSWYNLARLSVLDGDTLAAKKYYERYVQIK
jgi:tetratricopeptide (TPR) repeat protein